MKTDAGLRKGFALIELMVCIGLAALLTGLSLYALKPGPSKVSTISLAHSLTGELRAARQLAISSGHPVAIGIPRQPSEVANSIYRLEGWNIPVITWAKGFKGDYPNLGFAAARWDSGDGSFDKPVELPPLAKITLALSTAIRFEAWLPTEYRQDSIFCYTPDGNLVGHNAPAYDKRYTIVVAQSPKILDQVISAGGEAVTIYLSPNGGIEYSKGTPGTELPSNGLGSIDYASMQHLHSYKEVSGIVLSDIITLPKAEESDVDAICKPGQQITFEVYAYDEVHGRELFARWNNEGKKESGATAELGIFTVPEAEVKDNAGNPISVPAERMEYVQAVPDYVTWPDKAGGGKVSKPANGCFRARWTWTVPLSSEKGDKYTVTADVQDVTGTAEILNPHPKKILKPEETGVLLAEVFNTDRKRLEIVQISKNGKNVKTLTSDNFEEAMPSVSKNGKKLALISSAWNPGSVSQLDRPAQAGDKRYIVVRNIDGSNSNIVDGPGAYNTVSISPNGEWVAYRDQVADKLYVRSTKPNFEQKLDRAQKHGGGYIDDVYVNKDRVGWTPNSKNLLWGDDQNLNMTNIEDGSDKVLITNSTFRVHGVASFNYEDDDNPYIVASLSTSYTDVLVFPLSFLKDNAPVNVQKSKEEYKDGYSKYIIDYNDADSQKSEYGLPSISSDGAQVVITRTLATGADGSYQRSGKTSAFVGSWNNSAQNFEIDKKFEKLNGPYEVRSVVWLD